MATRARTGISAVVNGCPGWTMADLVRHVGGGQRWIEVALRTGATDESDVRVPPAPDDDELVEWLEEGVQRFVTTARAVDREAPMRLLWNTDGRVGGHDFLRRRATNEAAIHRWDAERATGDPTPIPKELAVDCLDELLMGWLPWAAAVGRQARGDWSGESIVLRTSDADAAWRVTFMRRGWVEAAPDSDDEPALAAVIAEASDLVLYAMNRDVRAGAIELAGDHSVVARWKDEVRFGSRQPPTHD